MSYIEIIRRKRDGLTLSSADIRRFVNGAVAGEVADYQIAAFLMSAFLRGLTEEETADLTLAMAESGEVLSFPSLGRVVDKHSTGGVGDTTTLIAAPLVAACGVPVAKMTGRGLGHTGGTVDKLESIPGFSTALSIEKFVAQVEELGIGLISATRELAPADALFYSLRDVTATVDNIPLIASSIMSKKIAAGATHIVLDVKYGRGAFMESAARAEELAQKMVRVGEMTGRPTTALISAMDSPLGCAVGNALEVNEAVAILQNAGGSPRLRAVSLAIAAEMLLLHRGTSDPEAVQEELLDKLESGAAYACFESLIRAQGGDLSKPLPAAPYTRTVLAQQGGYVSAVDPLVVGRAAMSLGAGRSRKEDAIDPAAGIVILAMPGTRIGEGEPLAVLHGRRADMDAVSEKVGSAFTMADAPPPETPPVLKVLRSVL